MSDTERIPGSNRDAGHRVIIGTTREGMTRPFQESASKQGHTMTLGDTRAGKTKLAAGLIESFVNAGGKHGAVDQEPTAKPLRHPKRGAQ